MGDSIPRQVLLKWNEEDELWLKAHGVEGSSGLFHAHSVNGPEDRSTALPEKLQAAYARRTARRLHVELDACHGSCLFRKPEVRKVLEDALRHFHGGRWWLGDYVIMPNHVHLLVLPIIEESGAAHCSAVARSSGPCGNKEGSGAAHRSMELEDILASVKGFVSTRLTRQGFKKGKLWQQENYDRLVRDRDELKVWRKYIRGNPGKAKLRSDAYTLYECTWL
ncbi:transposase [Pontiella sp.]|uniref:transposase n=1 Tax=Pontiella sp. TaxID=2837462 RepID=UPI00356414E4